MAANQVQVDEPEIGARFAALEGEAIAAAQAAEQHVADQTHEPDSWLPGAKMVVDIIDAKVCPNWELSATEKGDLSTVIAETLDHYFPGSIAGFDNWHPISKLCFVSAAVALPRFDWKAGGFAPMHEPRKDDDNNEQERRPVDGGDGSEQIG